MKNWSVTVTVPITATRPTSLRSRHERRPHDLRFAPRVALGELLLRRFDLHGGSVRVAAAGCPAQSVLVDGGAEVLFQLRDVKAENVVSKRPAQRLDLPLAVSRCAVEFRI